MQRYSIFALVMLGLLTLASLVNASPTTATPLNTGVLFPQLSGRTLSGKVMELPTAAIGKPALVVFSFSRIAGKDARLWNEHLFRSFSDSIPCYEVIVLESVPKLFRGMAIAGITRSVPARMQSRAIVLYQDEKLWKRRLSVSDNRAYVVLLGQDGHVRWINSGAYTDPEYSRLEEEIKKLLQPRR